MIMEISAHDNMINYEKVKLSIRAKNALQANNIDTVKKLINLTEDDLIGFQNLGIKTVKEICNYINEIQNGNLSLVESDPVENLDTELLKLTILEYEIANAAEPQFGLSNKAYNLLIGNGYDELYDIVHLDAKKLAGIKQMGSKTVTEILLKIKSIKHDCRKMFRDKGLLLDEKVIEKFGSNNISDIIPTHAGMLLPLGVLKISDLEKLRYSDLLDAGIDISSIKNIILSINEIKPLDEIVNNFDYRGHKSTTIERIVENKTLEEIGSGLMVSRERVRQVMHRVFFEFDSHLKANNIRAALEREFPGRNYIFKDELEKKAGCDLFAKMLEQENSFVHYYKPLDIFFLEGFKEFTEDVEDFIENMDSVVSSFEATNDLFEILDRYNIIPDNIHQAIEIFEYYGVINYKEYFSKQKLTFVEISNILFKNHIDEPITINEAGAEKIKSLSVDVLGVEMQGGWRAIEGRIRDAESIVMCGPRTFIHYDKIEFSMALVSQIDQYLSELSKIKDTENIQNVYAYYIKTHGKKKALSLHALYSIIKIHLGDKYSFGRKNTMDIKLQESATYKSVKDQLIKYLESNGGSSRKRDIVRDLGWSELRYTNTVNNYKCFSVNSNRQVRYIKNHILDSNDHKKLYSIIVNELRKGVVLTRDVLKVIQETPTLSPILNKHDIQDISDLTLILKNAFPFLIGSSNVLFDKNSDIKNFKDYIYKNYKTITYDELINIYDSVYQSRSTTYSHVNQLLESGLYIKDGNTFIRSDK